MDGRREVKEAVAGEGKLIMKRRRRPNWGLRKGSRVRQSRWSRGEQNTLNSTELGI